MKTFTIDKDNNITAFDTAEEASAATAAPFDFFSSEKELAELIAGWPAERLVATWNTLPGVTPAKSFKGPKAGAHRIWERIQHLGDPAKLKEPGPKAACKAKGGARAPKGAPAKAKATKKATAAKKAPKGKKTAKASATAVPREGSKTAQVGACSNGRMARRWLRSWRRWAGRNIPSGGLWPAR